MYALPLETQEDYDKAIEFIEPFFNNSEGPDIKSVEGYRYMTIIWLIVQYENEHYPTGDKNE